MLLSHLIQVRLNSTFKLIVIDCPAAVHVDLPPHGLEACLGHVQIRLNDSSIESNGMSEHEGSEEYCHDDVKEGNRTLLFKKNGGTYVEKCILEFLVIELAVPAGVPFGEERVQIAFR